MQGSEKIILVTCGFFQFFNIELQREQRRFDDRVNPKRCGDSFLIVQLFGMDWNYIQKGPLVYSYTDASYVYNIISSFVYPFTYTSAYEI